MNYNPLPDLFILGTFLAALFATLHYMDKRKPKPYKRVHMVDQKGRYSND